METEGTGPGAEVPPSRGPHVLVVDDDHAAAEQIERTVQALGYRVTVATSWSDALRLFLRGDVELVLMDAVMPTVDGFKLTKILRERSTSYTPIIFLTSLQDGTAHERGLAAGADDFLRKPVDQFELRVRMGAMMRIRHLTRSLEEKTAALHRLAHTDALTGVGNRRTFNLEFPREIERATQFDHDISLLMIDLDHFKSINDTHGHAAGDAVLAFFGAVLRGTLRAPDLAFRYGGEEFVVIAPETDLAGARVLAERIRQRFEACSGQETPCGTCTLSVGVSSLAATADQGDPAQTLLCRADQAVYRAKELGRNRVVCSTSASSHQAA